MFKKKYFFERRIFLKFIFITPILLKFRKIYINKYKLLNGWVLSSKD